MIISGVRVAVLSLLAAILAAPTPAAGGQVTQERETITIQGPPLPGFPGQRQFKTGTARIRGRVLTADGGGPIRRAQVRIAGPDVATKTALTGADGRYEFRDLPAGRFSVTASKAGYVTVEYGQTRPFEAGKRIELAEKQALDNADLTMPRGGVISGRVVDEFGEAVADATVTSMRQTWAGGRRRLAMTGRTAQTNDLGQFRLYGLPPGDYYVSASLRGGEAFMLDMLAVGGSGPTASGTTSGYAPTYFPGTASAADAQKIVLAAGQEIGSTDFALLPVRLARVSGTVIGADGKPLEGAMINLVPATRGAEGPMMMLGNSTRTSKDGAFTVSSVTPGEYVLQARTVHIVTSEGGGNMMFTARIGGEGDDSEFGAVGVTVAGEDLPNVIVVTSKGGSVSGRIVFDGVARPTTLGMLRVAASAPDADGPMG